MKIHDFFILCSLLWRKCENGPEQAEGSELNAASSWQDTTGKDSGSGIVQKVGVENRRRNRFSLLLDTISIASILPSEGPIVLTWALKTNYFLNIQFFFNHKTDFIKLMVSLFYPQDHPLSFEGILGPKINYMLNFNNFLTIRTTILALKLSLDMTFAMTWNFNK